VCCGACAARRGLSSRQPQQTQTEATPDEIKQVMLKALIEDGSLKISIMNIKYLVEVIYDALKAEGLVAPSDGPEKAK
jgi:hypothetical protein